MFGYLNLIVYIFIVSLLHFILWTISLFISISLILIYKLIWFNKNINKTYRNQEKCKFLRIDIYKLFWGIGYKFIIETIVYTIVYTY